LSFWNLRGEEVLQGTHLAMRIPAVTFIKHSNAIDRCHSEERSRTLIGSAEKRRYGG